MRQTRTLRTFLRGACGERAAVAVEFALVAPIFLIFILGIVDLGRLFYVRNIMQYGVEQTARYVMVNPEVSQADLETYAQEQVSNMFDGITFTADEPGADVVGGVSYRTVSASYLFDYMMPLVDLTNVPLSTSLRTPVNSTD
ncbi:MAG: pilus assembly protein [Alphaproteobacteria bacterium]|nr:pilus assembly protein [Alphaproteobacteria bacterium]MBF0250017.1 pilus assembly protein [Alphaproteobacteria bacterium]